MLHVPSVSSALLVLVPAVVAVLLPKQPATRLLALSGAGVYTSMPADPSLLAMLPKEYSRATQYHGPLSLSLSRLSCLSVRTDRKIGLLGLPERLAVWLLGLSERLAVRLALARAGPGRYRRGICRMLWAEMARSHFASRL